VFTPAPAAVKTPAGRLTTHHRSQSSSNFFLVLDEDVLVGRKEQAFIQNDAATASLFKASDNMLKKQRLGGTCLDAPAVWKNTASRSGCFRVLGWLLHFSGDWP
jgi:hypothetical protein